MFRFTMWMKLRAVPRISWIMCCLKFEIFSSLPPLPVIFPDSSSAKSTIQSSKVHEVSTVIIGHYYVIIIGIFSCFSKCGSEFVSYFTTCNTVGVMWPTDEGDFYLFDFSGKFSGLIASWRVIIEQKYVLMTYSERMFENFFKVKSAANHEAWNCKEYKNCLCRSNCTKIGTNSVFAKRFKIRSSNSW